MKFSTPVLTAMTVIPAVNAWSCGPSGFTTNNGLFVRPGIAFNDFSPVTSPEEIRRRQREFFNRAFAASTTRSSPRYDIIETDEQVKIVLDVPGVKAEDINVTVEDDGKVLSIAGFREKENENGTFQSKFAQNFAIDPTVDIENSLSAVLKNGVLVVTAQKDLQRLERNIRKIPVVPVDDDDVLAKGNDDSSTVVENSNKSSSVKPEGTDKTDSDNVSKKNIPIDDDDGDNDLSDVAP